VPRGIVEVEVEEKLEPVGENDGEGGLTDDEVRDLAYVDLASELGWVPEEQYKGDKSRWTDARTFLKNAGDITKKQHVTIERLNRDMDTIKKDIKITMQTQGKIAQQQVDKLTAELKEARREKIMAGDVDGVEEIDSQIEEANKSVEQAPAEVDRENPEYTSWLEENPWYGTDQSMTRFADTVADQYDADKVPLKSILKAVDTEMERLGIGKPKADVDPPPANPGGRVTNVATGGRRTRTSSGKHAASDLTYELRGVGQRMVDSGIFDSLDDYADAYFKGLPKESK